MSRTYNGYIYKGVWANRPGASTVPSGSQMFVTDYGSSAGSVWVSDGTYWRPLGKQTIVLDVTRVAGAASTSEQFLKQFTFPAGMLRGCRAVNIVGLASKTGLVDIIRIRHRMGTAGTSADTTILDTSGVMPAATRQAHSNMLITPVSDTAVAFLLSTQNMGMYTSGATTTAYGTTFTVGNMVTNPIIVSITYTPAGTTDTVTAENIIIEVS